MNSSEGFKYAYYYRTFIGLNGVGIALCLALSLAIISDCGSCGYKFQKFKFLYMESEAKKMGEKNDERIKTLLTDVDREFHRLPPCLQAKFAIEQISVWQQKFNEAKSNILEEDLVDATAGHIVIGQEAEIES